MALLCDEAENASTLRTVLEASVELKSALILVGPEGGWTNEERTECLAVGGNADKFGQANSSYGNGGIARAQPDFVRNRSVMLNEGGKRFFSQVNCSQCLSAVALRLVRHDRSAQSYPSWSGRRARALWTKRWKWPRWLWRRERRCWPLRRTAFRAGREHNGRFVEEAVAKLQMEIDQRGITLRLIPGIELPMRSDTRELLKSGELIPLGGRSGKVVLIEPPFNQIPPTALPLLKSLQDDGYLPLIAHPERNSEVQHDLAFVEACAMMGMAIQLTAGSILGKFGPRAEAAAKRIAIRQDWMTVIASDAHEQHERTPADMRLAANKVSLWLGGDAQAQETARRMVEDTPMSFLPVMSAAL